MKKKEGGATPVNGKGEREREREREKKCDGEKKNSCIVAVATCSYTVTVCNQL